MLLVDSIYVNMGGGLSLLKYLVETLQAKDVRFRLLVDTRADCQFPYVADQVVLSPSESSRIKFYKAFPHDVTSVFCFGNVPPPIKLNVPVYTYFHNINMLTLSDACGWKQKIKFFLKREYIRSLRDNTDKWFVQTSNTANELISHLGVLESKVKLFPFYRAPKLSELSDERADYIFVGEDTGNKGHEELLLAWSKLREVGVNSVLHLTVSSKSALYPKIQNLINNGVRIINHGIIPFDELIKVYSTCKATVYPSPNESFGLGVVEAMELGCDVIAPDLPYIHSICKPSEVFESGNSNSILAAVVKYERGCSYKTEQIVQNEILGLIQTLLDK